MTRELHIGLEGIAIAESKITYVDGVKGELIYRSHWAGELARDKSFEEVLHLVMFGSLPDASQLAALKDKLISLRTLSPEFKAVIRTIPAEVPHMAALRSVLSMVTVPEDQEYPPTPDQALRLVALTPTILAYRHACLSGKEAIEPHASLAHVENYLYMLNGRELEPGLVRALTAYLVLSMDHEINASTFTARVVVATQADLVSSVCAAIGALIGPLHGGAPSKVDDLLDEIGTEDRAEQVMRQKIESGERLMGFGHRVYKTWDPRAAALKYVAERNTGSSRLLQLSLHVEKVAVELLEKYKPGRNLYPNIEFWAAAVLRSVNLPKELYTPTFCCSRMVGWCAHVIEQSENNRLIRPNAIYTGAWPDHEQAR
ncbi:MAG: citrate/2-methylcitrate synthase [Pseudomonadota bacterium]